MAHDRHERPLKYREAYPRIDLVEADAAICAARPVCIFWNKKWPIGQAYLEENETADGSVVLIYFLQGPGMYYGSGRVQLGIERSRAGMKPYRRHLLCPACAHRIQIIILKDCVWKCGSCHGLHYRSQVIDRPAAMAERIATLEERIGQGRPAGMHRSTYARLTHQLDKVRRRVGKFPQASGAHRRIISAQWVEPKDIPDRCWLPGYIVEKNKMVRFMHRSHDEPSRISA